MTANDKVAVISFNSTIKTLIDFTSEHGSATQQIRAMDAEPNSGTCLYDAAYKAVQMSAGLPKGRRAIILLTDGKVDVSASPMVNASAARRSAIH